MDVQKRPAWAFDVQSPIKYIKFKKVRRGLLKFIVQKSFNKVYYTLLKFKVQIIVDSSLLNDNEHNNNQNDNEAYVGYYDQMNHVYHHGH